MHVEVRTVLRIGHGWAPLEAQEPTPEIDNGFPSGNHDGIHSAETIFAAAAAASASRSDASPVCWPMVRPCVVRVPCRSRYQISCRTGH